MTVRRLSAALTLVLLAAACSPLEKKPAPPCPPVYILPDVGRVTKYRAGPGRDYTDVEVQAEIVGYQGECVYKPRGDAWDINIELQVALEVKRGPANTARTSELTYFVALPMFFPRQEAKAEFPVTVKFPDDVDIVRHIDESVSLSIPVKTKDLIDKYEIYLGFQTTPEELEYNRRGK
jgi:hypothetical protein